MTKPSSSSHCVFSDPRISTSSGRDGKTVVNPTPSRDSQAPSADHVSTTQEGPGTPVGKTLLGVGEHVFTGADLGNFFAGSDSNQDQGPRSASPAVIIDESQVEPATLDNFPAISRERQEIGHRFGDDACRAWSEVHILARKQPIAAWDPFIAAIEVIMAAERDVRPFAWRVLIEYLNGIRNLDGSLIEIMVQEIKDRSAQGR